MSDRHAPRVVDLHGAHRRNLPTMVTKSNAQPTLTGKTWGILIVAACITAFLALGSHDLAIAHLGIPFPYLQPTPGWARCLGQVTRIGAMVCVCHLARWYLDRRSLPVAAIIFSLLILMIQETLRAVIVDNVVTDGLVHLRWLYSLMMRAPDIAMSIFTATAAVIIARRLRHAGLIWISIAVVLAAALDEFALMPLVDFLSSWVDTSLHLTQPPAVYTMPYGFYVYKYIYATFIEPTIASFVLVYLMWPALPGSKSRRVASFVLIMLLMRGRVAGIALFSFWVDGSRIMAIAAEGQFFIETLILTTLTALTWAALTPKDR
ncbi:hypothetical protein [Hephaestia mangrovi]|uniref:hypothetical protein n=1 Tax=Hephaestia mangrovi TaxID=2873268 RepID=UPI001CA6556E|nr:hypothetical protein [Hephaestia mangrovi]MBY8829848.1 hypothetical protein [Hephaestia mangrovi]